MNEMIERVARVLCAHNRFPPNCGWTTEEISDYVDEHWREEEGDAARLAISAMRKPNEAMVIAGADTDGRGAAYAVWSDMIDAALAEPAEPPA